MIIKILVSIFTILIAVVVYKLVLWMLKKAKDESIKILNECKTEEERANALKAARRRNLIRAIIFYMLLFIGIPLLCLPLFVFLRTVQTL